MTVHAISGATGGRAAMANRGTERRVRVLPWIPRSSGLGVAAGIGCALAVMAQSDPAAADFRLCNNTTSRVGIAVGYKENDTWATEGWWNLNARSCETLLRGPLVARYYYIYAVDYDRGGEWSGQAYMCTRDKEFTIRGTEDCLARGFDRTGFFEVDTGEQRAWTVQLTDTADGVPPRSVAPRATPLPSPGRQAPTQLPGTPPR